MDINFRIKQVKKKQHNKVLILNAIYWLFLGGAESILCTACTLYREVGYRFSENYSRFIFTAILYHYKFNDLMNTPDKK